MNRDFIQGLQLSELFYTEIVKQIIETQYPDMRYASALIGPGSEVLGFDDIISTDHHWGPRVQIFLSDIKFEEISEELKELLREKLPYTFHGYSTHWSEPDPNDSMNQFLQPKSEGKINHRVEITTVTRFIKRHLDIVSTEISEKEWLVIPEHLLLEFTSGKVFFDSLGELTKTRKNLEYYPENVWKFKILSLWEYIAQEVAFVGRTGIIGDEIGSRLETARLVRYIIKMSYTMDKKYTPYQKWLGTGFKQLSLSVKLEKVILKTLKTENWNEREKLLCQAYKVLIEKQNELELTEKIEIKPQPYFNRPQVVINISKITKILSKTIKKPLKSLYSPIGGVDNFIDETNILSNASIAKKALNFL